LLFINRCVFFISRPLHDSFYFFQGYDDIPKEIPDTDAKKVCDLIIHFIYVMHLLYSYIIIYCAFCSQRTGMMRKMVNGLPLPFQTQITRDRGSKRYDYSVEPAQSLMSILMPYTKLFHLPENQEPQLPG
jgi:hypothetical protein